MHYNSNIPSGLLLTKVAGHVKIVDDLGVVHLDKENAIHSQNMARVFSRALSNELSNTFIKRVAFGDGGTQVDALFNVVHRSVNDGQSPDVSGYASRLYNETYSEIVDDSNPLIGTDPGSADASGIRTGGGANPNQDPTSIEHGSGPGVVSVELGLISQSVVTVVLNATEPSSQQSTGGAEFRFDELALYTDGASPMPSFGYQNIDVGNRISTDDSGLLASTTYGFTIDIDGGAPQNIQITTGVATPVTYGDVCELINTVGITGGVARITDYSGAYPTLVGAQTYGFLQFSSSSNGIGSSVQLTDVTGGGVLLLDTAAAGTGLNPPNGTVMLGPINGASSGIQNDANNPTTERERMLTHLIFDPIAKSANRIMTITYTLSISVARS